MYYIPPDPDLLFKCVFKAISVFRRKLIPTSTNPHPRIDSRIKVVQNNEFGNGFSWHGDGQISNHENREKNRVKNATETETDIHIPFL